MAPVGAVFLATLASLRCLLHPRYIEDARHPAIAGCAGTAVSSRPGLRLPLSLPHGLAGCRVSREDRPSRQPASSGCYVLLLSCPPAAAGSCCEDRPVGAEPAPPGPRPALGSGGAGGCRHGRCQPDAGGGAEAAGAAALAAGGWLMVATALAPRLFRFLSFSTFGLNSCVFLLTPSVTEHALAASTHRRTASAMDPSPGRCV